MCYHSSWWLLIWKTGAWLNKLLVGSQLHKKKLFIESPGGWNIYLFLSIHQHRLVNIHKTPVDSAPSTAPVAFGLLIGKFLQRLQTGTVCQQVGWLTCFEKGASVLQRFLSPPSKPSHGFEICRWIVLRLKLRTNRQRSIKIFWRKFGFAYFSFLDIPKRSGDLLSHDGTSANKQN